MVGAYLAVYSVRGGEAGPVRVCNLAAFCVLKEFRMHGLRLARALLAQQDYVFTDLSPSGNVVGLNERLGLRRLDTSTRLVANLPSTPRRGIRVSGDPEVIARVLRHGDSDVYRDHRAAAAARHIVAEHAGGYAYLVFRRDRRKGLPLFASPLYVGGDPAVLEAAWPSVTSHILLAHHLPATLAERRILGFTPRRGFELRSPRPKMTRGGRLAATDIDYLYSELALVEW
ncbi:hypothetical protein GJV80_14890 [Microlunatus sp. Gsoil 973]|nr:hypothetical protein GJV80_14890 [Microlunatus sp. Gsoil 973]